MEYKKKFSTADIEAIQSHYMSEEVSFPMPDKKLVGKRFMHSSVSTPHKMYNLLPSMTHEISASTYYKYKAKFHSDSHAVKNVRTLKIQWQKYPNT